ncbi:hypothetical protein DIJ62_09260 [Burkholderia pseudomallei]|nr:hypothetical protein DIJ62_09260 [Burkholderia pseudomallei]
MKRMGAANRPESTHRSDGPCLAAIAATTATCPIPRGNQLRLRLRLRRSVCGITRDSRHAPKPPHRHEAPPRRARIAVSADGVRRIEASAETHLAST